MNAPRTPVPLHAAFDPSPAKRLAAVSGLGKSPACRHVLRTVMTSDSDGRVRARAAARLGSRVGVSMIAPLTEAAVHDALPAVREAAWRSLARSRPELLSTSVIAAARERLATETVWWVRMAIAAVLARRPGPTRATDLREVLLDPFWRVRHAAVKALLGLGEASAAAREEILSAPVRSDVEGAALLYLRRAWDGDRAELLEPLELSSPPPSDPLWDPDPAVITARLEAPQARPSLALLVELLADAHLSTRREAFRHLEQRASVREIRVALEWLDEPRIPYASEMATRLAASLGERCLDLVLDVLDGGSGPGPLCWAAAWVGETKSVDLGDKIEALLDHPSEAVRETAIGALYALGRASAASRRLIEIALAGEQAERTIATSVLLRVEPGCLPRLLAAVDSAPARARRLLASAATDGDWLESRLRDPDPETRAMALGKLLAEGSLSSNDREAALADADPWIRLAVLDDDCAGALASFDPDPIVRRAALRRCTGSSVAARSARLRAADASDPRLRAEAAGVLATRDDELAALLALSSDRVPMARVAAVSRLENAGPLDDAVLELLAATPLRRGALTWLCRELGDDAAGHLERTFARDDLSSDDRRHVQTVRLALPDSVVCSVPAASPRPPRVRKALAPLAPRSIDTVRPLGRTGMHVSPLIISGVKNVSMGSLRATYDAGVNTFFWEPLYHQLGAFLRRPEIGRTVQVVAGSYHGTGDAIEADVESALRRLRRNRIDLFLLYWVRSPERLSPEIRYRLEALKQSGKIGAFGFSTHHRDIAADAISRDPWDAIMIRHSAAHVGAEESLLSLADERGVGVLAFTSLCYGRLLRPSEARARTSAPDCYRYSLSQPGISAVVSAPGRHREALENVEVLRETDLGPEDQASMREHGAWIYEQSKDFGALIRRTPRALPREAAARLRSERERESREPT